MTAAHHPASFRNWTNRRTLKLRHNGHPLWQPTPPTAQTPRVAAVLHVFYPELLPQLLEQLAHLPVAYDLFITNASGTPLEIDRALLGRVAEVRVLPVPNHGRDILPLIEVVNAGFLEPYELVLKLHTKRSEWRDSHETLAGDGEQWREHFISDLVGNPDRVRHIMSLFVEQPGVGVLTAEGSIVGAEHWGGNRDLVEQLLLRLELRLPPSLQFASGSMYWIRGFLLDGLRAFDLSAEDFDEETGQIDGTTAHAIERILGIIAEEAGFTIADASLLHPQAAKILDGTDSPDSPEPSESWHSLEPGIEPQPAARVVPFYLPQFHDFPENNAWWGKGFTEWNNVASAKPLFLGHRQPLLPSDLGYYSLRQPEIRKQQYELAQKAGITGFMYYYYWFEGKRLMDLPVEQLRASDDEHPFCLMWANENWTRRWDGWEDDVLIAQNYDRVPATEFIEDVRDFITDPRYFRIDDKPVLAVYRITQIPNYSEVIEHWRQRAADFGLPGLTLLSVDVSQEFQGVVGDVREVGLDGVLEFPPHNRLWVHPNGGIHDVHPEYAGAFLRYDSLAEHAEAEVIDGVPDHRYPGVMVNFDNTARRNLASHVYYGANPFTFRRWLRTDVLALAHRPMDQRVIFVNAWNEWAEGAVLEPSQRFGRTYLHAVRSAVVELQRAPEISALSASDRNHEG